MRIYKTVLYSAIEKENIEIVKLLLTNEKLDINALNIFQYFYNIQNYIFQKNSKSLRKLANKTEGIGVKMNNNFMFM